jgi:hypothetical protein
VHTIVISSMIIFLKTLKLLHIEDFTGPSLGSTVNTSTFTHCSILLCNGSVCHTYSVYVEEFPSVLLHMQRIRIIFVNVFKGSDPERLNMCVANVSDHAAYF